jgi:hypothetical protein
MTTTTPSQTSFIGLLENLRDEARTFFRQEMQLVKSEMSEKFSHFGRNAIWIVGGALVAYAGVVLLLGAFGFLLAYLFTGLGLPSGMAEFAGLGIVGLLVAAIGAVLAVKSLKALSHESLVPEKSLHSLEAIGSGTRAPATTHLAVEKTVVKPKQPQPSSDELELRLGSTRLHIEETASEIKRRVSPRYLKRQVVTHVRQHPWQAGLVAAATSFAGWLMLRRKRIRNRVRYSRVAARA